MISYIAIIFVNLYAVIDNFNTKNRKCKIFVIIALCLETILNHNL